MFLDPTTWTWLLSARVLLFLFLSFVFFFCHFPPFHLFLCGVHNQSSSASAPAQERCLQAEHCCCMASHPTISSIKLGKWHLQSHGISMKTGFLLYNFAFVWIRGKGENLSCSIQCNK